MKKPLFYSAGSSPALGFACAALSDIGYTITDHPDEAVTHLLLPVPAFESDGILKGGLSLDTLLAKLPESVTVIGGNLDTALLRGYRTIDLLKDEHYLSVNALITAHCALKLACTQITGILMNMPVLVVGWGRIGKHLARLLQGLGADVTVAARKDTDRGMLDSLGFRTTHPADIPESSPYRLVFNTAPQLILREQPGSIAIDLASVKGIAGSNVIWARGLPGRDAPEASGRLIAQTVQRLILEQEG